MTGEGSGSTRQPIRRWIVKLAWLGVPLLLLGETGHLLFDWAREQLAHHLFHIVFGLGAGLVFFAYVVVDIRRHGWPQFSWRLHPPPPTDPSA